MRQRIEGLSLGPRCCEMALACILVVEDSITILIISVWQDSTIITLVVEDSITIIAGSMVTAVIMATTKSL